MHATFNIKSIITTKIWKGDETYFNASFLDWLVGAVAEDESLRTLIPWVKHANTNTDVTKQRNQFILLTVVDTQIKVAFKWEFVYDEKLVRQGPTFDSSCNELNQQKTEQKEMALRWQKSFWFPPPMTSYFDFFRVNLVPSPTFKNYYRGWTKTNFAIANFESTTRRREAKENAKSKFERVEYGIGLWSCRLAFRHGATCICIYGYLVCPRERYRHARKDAEKIYEAQGTKYNIKEKKCK